ncbi:hypothetical protein FEQ05_01007 [Burkholderia pseudomultivorans]|uniref:Uncharacterized protein n=1 Tax=Burkholderia pseudomultivorans TaxID=1207504 RepID=A0ABU2DYH3_9BURK|nr:hypothetical protein [Burkholderia pseudomultivorans]MDR8735860.1 hypothetical protein [Burkholderia pseudomultivorans]MDR8741836.1 hypothetical protein [Burkholderia pseudomultivorans]MDR8752650.1 hypothetical protein [Burkholderia pseudomultivorans]MDR8778430.1 hypothetical protein [Burkholderia pseudomultivorans]
MRASVRHIHLTKETGVLRAYLEVAGHEPHIPLDLERSTRGLGRCIGNFYRARQAEQVGCGEGRGGGRTRDRGRRNPRRARAVHGGYPIFREQRCGRNRRRYRIVVLLHGVGPLRGRDRQRRNRYRKRVGCRRDRDRQRNGRHVELDFAKRCDCNRPGRSGYRHQLGPGNLAGGHRRHRDGHRPRLAGCNRRPGTRHRHGRARDRRPCRCDRLAGDRQPVDRDRPVGHRVEPVVRRDRQRRDVGRQRCGRTGRQHGRRGRQFDGARQFGSNDVQRRRCDRPERLCAGHDRNGDGPVRHRARQRRRGDGEQCRCVRQHLECIGQQYDRLRRGRLRDRRERIGVRYGGYGKRDGFGCNRPGRGDDRHGIDRDWRYQHRAQHDDRRADVRQLRRQRCKRRGRQRRLRRCGTTRAERRRGPGFGHQHRCDQRQPVVFGR